MSTTQASAQSIQATNMQNRLVLLGAGIRNRQQLQPVTGTIGGGQVSFTLQQTGLTTGVRIFVTCPLTITAALTASEFNPANLIRQITVTDQNGVTRTQCSGWQLYMTQCFKHRDRDGVSQSYASAEGVTGEINTNLWRVPTAISTDNLVFSLYIPFAYDAMSDLTGSILTQTQTGQVTIGIQFASALIGTDTYAYPYSAGAATSGTIQVLPVQEFIGTGNGINLGSLNQLPLIDINTSYGFMSQSTDTANIVTNGVKQIYWPTNRVILSALHFFENGDSGTLNETDVNTVKLLYNVVNPVVFGSPKMWRYSQRTLLNSDAPSGVYYIGRRNQPVSTNLMGQVITELDLGTVASSGKVGIESSYEMQYPLGSALPGL